MRLKRTFLGWCSLQIVSSLPTFQKPSFRHRKIVSFYSSSAMSAVSLDRTVEFSFSTGYENVIGVDEAGRGPLAGPVVVAACYIPRELSTYIDAVIQDSKKMNEEQREHGYKVLMNEPRVKYAVSIVSHTEIDELNILQASLTGMRRATIDLLDILKKDSENNDAYTNKSGKNRKVVSAAFDSSHYLALVDGNKIPSEMPIECKAIIKGDSRVYSIAAASIIAKVVRDHLMVDLDKEYPQYNFAKHKGYPTAEHRALVMHYGPCPYHRRSYGPVKIAMEAMEKRSTKRSTNEISGTEESTSSNKKRRSAAKAPEISTKEESTVDESTRRKRNAKKIPIEVAETEISKLRRSTRIAKDKK